MPTTKQEKRQQQQQINALKSKIKPVLGRSISDGKITNIIKLKNNELYQELVT